MSRITAHTWPEACIPHILFILQCLHHAKPINAQGPLEDLPTKLLINIIQYCGFTISDYISKFPHLISASSM